MAVFILLCIIVAGMCFAATVDAVSVKCDRVITVSMGFGLMLCVANAWAASALIGSTMLSVAMLGTIAPLIVATRAIAH